ncbi:MAG TPA: hypothetical protein VGH99_07315 [Pseudonocardia sp.]|jgi:hypothetical protein
MKRLFWLGLGVATGVMVTRKVADAAQRITPAGVGEQIGDGLREMAGALGAFGAEVRAGMTEREHELTDLVEHRTGVALPGATTHTPSAARRAPGAAGRD